MAIICSENKSQGLATWQKEALDFLSSHKKYRVLCWQFGPSLLDYLQSTKEKKGGDSLKMGLSVTYAVACLLPPISLTWINQRSVVAAITLGAALIALLITVAIDSRNIKKVESTDISQKDCFAMLERLGEMPQYWWWPWSGAIKHVQVTGSAPETSIGWMRTLFTNERSRKMAKIRSDLYVNGGNMSHSIVPSYSLPSKDPEIFDEQSVTLKQAFQILNIRSFSLLSLDQSIRDVTSGNKTMEEHRALVDKKTREVMKLSRLYHPDKAGKSNAQKQHLVNHTVEAIRKINDDMLKDKQMLQQSLIVYRLFEDATIQHLINRPTWETLNQEAYIELKEITFWKEQSLLSQRNLYLKNTRAYLHDLLEPAHPLSPDSLASIKETFDQAYKRYTSVYEKKWVKNLRDLSKTCRSKEKKEDLKLIQEEVDLLLKEAEKHYKQLENQSYPLDKEHVDDRLIRPILEYKCLMTLYFNFFDLIINKKIPYNPSHENRTNEAVKKEIKALSFQELIDSAQKMYKQVPQPNPYWFSRNYDKDEIKNLIDDLFFHLECAKELLEKTFQIQETFSEKMDKENAKEFQLLLETKQRIAYLNYQAEQDRRKKEEFEKIAKQQAERAEREIELRKRAEEEAEESKKMADRDRWEREELEKMTEPKTQLRKFAEDNMKYYNEMLDLSTSKYGQKLSDRMRKWAEDHVEGCKKILNTSPLDFKKCAKTQ